MFRLYLLKPLVWLLVIGIIVGVVWNAIMSSGLLVDLMLDYIDTERISLLSRIEFMPRLR